MNTLVLEHGKCSKAARPPVSLLTGEDVLPYHPRVASPFPVGITRGGAREHGRGITLTSYLRARIAIVAIEIKERKIKGNYPQTGLRSVKA